MYSSGEEEKEEEFFLLLPEVLLLLLLGGGGEELVHLERAASGMVPGSGRRARGAHRLRAVDQAARRRLPGAPASNQQHMRFRS